ncbi:Hexaprenyldihydroxybenzoate methyltransferase, mitochondrial, partial [Ascosphaera atra]
DPAVFNHLQTGTFKYINASVEDLVASGLPEQPKPKFDVITLFEVLEHVSPHTSSPQEFLKHILSLLRPGGWLIGSTIARALPAYVLHDLIAEAPWPLGVVPRGTHDWHKFVNPDEVKTWAARSLKVLAREEVEASEKEVADPTAPEAPVKEHLHDPSLFMKFRSTGAVYIPGCGWKLVPALSDYGNYFFAVQKN